MVTKKYTLDEVMTLKDAAERFNIKQETIKNRLKPSIVGQDKIDSWVSEGVIRKSSETWLVTEEFIKNNFKTLT